MGQQVGSLYGQEAGYGQQDMYGMQGGYMGGMGGGQPPVQYQAMYGQPQPQQWGGMPGQGYDQMGYGGGMMGFGGVQQQPQHPGANLRQARHQRYGDQNGGWRDCGTVSPCPLHT